MDLPFTPKLTAKEKRLCSSFTELDALTQTGNSSATSFKRWGYRTFSIDLRGHGESSPKEIIEEADYLAMPNDVNAAITWLTKQGATSIHAVGSGLGASAVLTSAANNQEIDSIILIESSP